MARRSKSKSSDEYVLEASPQGSIKRHWISTWRTSVLGALANPRMYSPPSAHILSADTIEAGLPNVSLNESSAAQEPTVKAVLNVSPVVAEVSSVATTPISSGSSHSETEAPINLHIVTNKALGNLNGRSEKPMLRPKITELPQLPDIISEDLRTQVFTHRSVYARPTHMFEDAPDDPSPDNEMVEHLGDSVLQLVITELIRDVHSYLRVGPSTKIRALVVGNPTLASISVMYNLNDRLIPHPAQAVTLRASPHIQADLFEAYVGGVYLDRGLDITKSWLRPLFRPYIREAYRIVRVEHGLSPDPVPTPAPSGSSHPRRNGTSWSSPAPSRNAPIVGHLSLFNQHMQQNSKVIEWEYSDSAGAGTKTTPMWVVRAVVGGECLGRGRGSTKKAARNEAAKEGLKNLGVYVPPIRKVLHVWHILSRLVPDALSKQWLGWSSRSDASIYFILPNVVYLS